MALLAIAMLCARAQAAPVNQPQVEVKEGSAFIQYSFPGGTYNVTVYGYVNVTNPATTTTLFNVNLTYQPLPAQFSITQVGAKLYNASPSSPYDRPIANMLTPGIIHVNEIPPATTYQILYMVTGTNLSPNVSYGTPTLIFANESVFLQSPHDPTHQWMLQNITYNSTINAYTTENQMCSGANASFLISYVNVGTAPLSNVYFSKQLPRSNNSSTGNASFNVITAGYWFQSNPSVFTPVLPDANNMLAFNVTSMHYLQPGDTLNVLINGSFSNITGNELPPGSGVKYITTSPAYLYFETGQPCSFLGNFIYNNSSNWLNCGGDASFSMEKGFNPLLNNWTFHALVSNPTDTSFILTNISVYRNNYPSPADFVAAVNAGPIWSVAPNVTLDPGGHYDAGVIVDSSYGGKSITQPPDYWVTFTWNVNNTVAGQPPNYVSHLVITGANPANVTMTEPYIRLVQWRLLVTKNVTYDEALGQYVVNISVLNTGFAPTTSDIRVYDFIPSGFNASSFNPIPDYTMPPLPSQPVINGPETIGWNLSIIYPGVVQNISYVIQGNMSEYHSSNLYVLGIDPMNIEGAIGGGISHLTGDIDSRSIDLLMANVMAALLLFVAFRKKA